jgi:hypothetical protein
MIYVKCALAGLLAVFSAAILSYFVAAVCLFWTASRSPQTGGVGWDLISIFRARPFSSLAVVVGVFLVGFSWEFYRLRSK